ncbi:MAG: TIM44-like domain-containing protein [Vulcanimicrobiota bacterium]
MKKNKQLTRFFLFAFIFLMLFALVSPDAFPRAGGGHKFKSTRTKKSSSSSSSTSSSSRSRGGRSRSDRSRDSRSRDSRSRDRDYYRTNGAGRVDGGGTSSPCTSSGCGIGGFILILIIFGIAIVGALTSKKKGSSDDIDALEEANLTTGFGYVGDEEEIETVSLDDLPPINQEKVEEQLAQIREKDPNFSKKVFLDKVQTSFYEIQRAWSKGNLEPVRSKMSDSQFYRMQMQLNEYLEKRQLNIVENVVIGSARIAEAGVEGDYDFIEVQITASMSDKTVNEQGIVISGSEEIVPVIEYWTFHRKQGAKTSEDGGRTPSNKCPSCGAPMEGMGESGKCEYCGATLTRASFDWILDTITQASEKME